MGQSTGAPRLAFMINGREMSANVVPGTPFLWVLRDHFALRGTKYGCGIGVCGACTVHIGGQAVRSCTVRAEDAQGREVTTIEGLNAGRDLHPVQQAWIEAAVPQCGYCQVGQIMTAAAALAGTGSRTRSNVLEALEGNLCRCGTYGRIREAVRIAIDAQARERAPDL